MIAWWASIYPALTTMDIVERLRWQFAISNWSLQHSIAEFTHWHALAIALLAYVFHRSSVIYKS